MIPLVSNLAPLVCAALLATTGAAKLFGRQTARLAANTVLVRVFNDGRRATLALRVLGGVELSLGAALLASPVALLPGAGTALLGVGFTGYLAYAKATAPESSCGCSARAEGPIGARSFTRAGLVVAGGLAAAGGDAAWWSEVSRRPGGSALVLAAAAAMLLGLTADLDRVWLVPLRKARIRVFGHPLPPASGERVPVAATVQLLENSLAWQTAMPVVRSALLDHWDDEGWRVLRYAGSYRDARGTHPVSVLFALDVTLTVDTAPNPAVRVSLIDEETEEVVPSSVLAPVPVRTPLPLAT
ncbi:MauE/DoxX family redox-associated membrane protein [Actinacidiphila paucisporea]|uniref:Methylamine utilisation protein MauE domain-containing protein n=1 Tax=Actinacidiphila paucisporea TaxID=310782 RepID=A0A1M7PFK7_9ACTN|nr:MauE/DoxX family redox-associated membrane protein [Actinacidiphila paucisporea]SHN15844.1 hypothetical protein SAMN05216499_12343 [Actinacidiphila paucisporea]